MKKLMGLFILTAVIFVSGCSVNIETSSTKTEEFALKAEALGETFEEAKDLLEPLKEKSTLSLNEQELVVQQLDGLTNEIVKFKNEEAPFIANIAKKVAVKELNKKEEVFLKTKEKAEKGEVEEEDIENILRELSNDIEVRLLK